MTLTDLVRSSAVTPSFADAVREFSDSGRSNAHLLFEPAPPVKIERTLIQMLVTFPDLPIERVRIAGRSGCEFFRGEMTVVAAEDEHVIDFEWNCRWKAEQLGWTDYFGFPDQIRAARELHHDCFRGWDLRGASVSG